jgi:Four helix bundle sensory module for signal transduction
MKRLMQVLAFLFTDRQTLGYLGYLLLLLGVLFALSFAAFYPLLREARLAVTQTLPSLAYGAEMNSVMADNFVRLMLMTDSQFRSQISTLAAQIERDTRDNEAVIERYQESIYSEEDRQNYEAFVATRRNFIAMRRQLVEQMQASPGRLDAESKVRLLSEFQKYRDAARRLIKYNARIGQERSARIQQNTIRAILFVIIAPVLIILIGVILGVRIFKL